tara:strand:+ start:382 stop:954 length:573 start_codon:yes stop_codon:yes gene_type:complete
MTDAASTVATVAPAIAGWSGFTVFMVAALAFAAGAIATFVFFRSTDTNADDTNDIQKKLQKSDQQLKRYQQEVSEHFITVSHLTTNIAQSYRQIHEHLASSAIRLASPEIGRQLLKSGGADISLLDAEGNPLVSMDDVQVPRDYAPKVPGGILSEGYGLADTETDGESDPPAPHGVNNLDTDSDPTENVS